MYVVCIQYTHHTIIVGVYFSDLRRVPTFAPRYMSYEMYTL